MKFIMLTNVKNLTVANVGILTFICIINTQKINATFDNSLKARKCFICQHFSFYEQLNFHAQLS